MTHYPQDDLVNRSHDSGETARSRYEAKIVSKLLTEFKLTKHEPLLREEQRKLTGAKDLTLDTFYAVFKPPIYLATGYVPHLLENNTQAQMCMTFGNRTYTKKYLEMLSSFGELEVPLGMVFGWPQLTGGMILHNGQRNTDYDGVFTCWRSGDTWLVLEPFAAFLRNLHYDWKPEL